MRIKLLKELQEYIYSLKGENGLWRDKPIGLVGKARTSKENLEKLKTAINILLASDKLSDDTKIFISSRKITVKAANDILNDARHMASEKLGKQLRNISYNVTVNRVNEDEQELINTVGLNFFKDLVYNMSVSENDFNQKLTKLIRKYSVYEKQRNNLNFYINADIVRCDKYKGNEEFFDILSTLEGYLVQRREYLEKQINENEEFVGYFNYLLSAKSLVDPIVAKDRERLLSFLSGSIYRSLDTNTTRVEQSEEIIENLKLDVGTDKENDNMEVFNGSQSGSVIENDGIGDSSDIKIKNESESDNTSDLSEDPLDFDLDDESDTVKEDVTEGNEVETYQETTDDSDIMYGTDELDPELMVEDYFIDMKNELNTNISKEEVMNKFTFKPKSE